MKKMIILSLVAGLLCCAHTADVGINTQSPTEEGDSPSDEAVIDEAEDNEASSEDTRASHGKILRSDLMVVINQGPAVLLSKVETKPFKQQGKFLGFQIAAFTQGMPTVIDLKPGDVILKVNGRKVERPEHYFEIFQELKVAGELRFDILRDGAAQTLLYPIVD